MGEHAASQACRRGLDLQVVLGVVEAPDQVLPVEGQREVRQSLLVDRSSGMLRLVRVVVDVESARIVVVTVYPTSKISKYWRRA